MVPSMHWGCCNCCKGVGIVRNFLILKDRQRSINQGNLVIS